VADDRREIADRRIVPRPGGRRATDEPPEWVTVSAFARKMGVDRGTVYKWLEAGILDTYRVGLLLRIRNIPPDEHHRRVTEGKLDDASSASVDER
jgi:excisionase family DNA binding protein